MKDNSNFVAASQKDGKFALWDKGKFIGWSDVVMIDGKRVTTDTAVHVRKMKAAAEKDKVKITVRSGLRTMDEQFELRKRNVIDKTKVDDFKYVMLEPSNKFSPLTAVPGWSNHQDGTAIDFVITKETFEWLKARAIDFGFVRTVASERWHWELRPDIKNMFAFVPKEHPSWS